MKIENRKSLEQLSLYCHVCGLVTIFLGVLTIGFDLVKKDFATFHIGLLIFIMGYSFVKIADKISAVLFSETDQ